MGIEGKILEIISAKSTTNKEISSVQGRVGKDGVKSTEEGGVFHDNGWVIIEKDMAPLVDLEVELLVGCHPGLIIVVSNKTNYRQRIWPQAPSFLSN